jgi:hypothetical protein
MLGRSRRLPCHQTQPGSANFRSEPQWPGRECFKGLSRGLPSLTLQTHLEILGLPPYPVHLFRRRKCPHCDGLGCRWGSVSSPNPQHPCVSANPWRLDRSDTRSCPGLGLPTKLARESPKGESAEPRSPQGPPRSASRGLGIFPPGPPAWLGVILAMEAAVFVVGFSTAVGTVSVLI